MPEWFSIIPPLVAIVLAFVTKEVISSIISGLLAGIILIQFQKDHWFGLVKSPFILVDTYLPKALVPNPEGGIVDRGHISIIIFSVLIGGVSMLIQKNGGMTAMVQKLTKFANTKKRVQLLTYFLGILIFFDDYANTLIVGNTTRGLAKKHRISREKMAYLVDSTAAPIAALAFATTWIGAELTYIADSTKEIESLHMSAYALFLSSIPYSFYAILTLVFIPILIIKNLDFGPMRKAEKKADLSEQDNGNQQNIESDKNPLGLALWPLGILSIGTFIGLIITGFSQDVWSDSSLSFFVKISKIIGNSNSYKALLWSSFISSIVAVLLSIGYKKLSLKQSVEALLTGYKSMIEAVVILILAWSLASVLEELGTSAFLEKLLVGYIPYQLLPAVVFLLAILVSFSTGSSWGTMAILFPLILSTSWKLFDSAELGMQANHLFYLTISSIMGGAVFGDHISPISDTTIMSSMATGCNHIAHVRTQMPYAISVGCIALFFGILPVSFGLSVWWALILSVLVMVLFVTVLSKNKKGT